jgi:ABC-type multidrug transport system fused ATPase/permease subunit
MMEIKPSIKDRPEAVPAKNIRGKILFDNVSFNYQNGPTVLHDVSFCVEPGQRVAVIGPTGCGKSTLASLIPRFYDVADGSVSVDGVDVRDYKLNSIRQNISLVFQEPILFATSIAENIAYGQPDSSMEEIMNAAEKAGIHHIIESLEDGYETMLGERGGTLSGGQRQCIAIARAIIKNAPVVIMDEPTTGLDNASANLVMGALQELISGRTVIMISHQMKTIRDVDNVIVMQAGRIVQQDIPSRVLSDPKLFEELQQMNIRGLSHES